MKLAILLPAARRILASAPLWALAALCASGAQPAEIPVVSENPRALVVARAVDIVGQWRPQQHLYVKGNVGASTEALDSLEQWLATKATNWVVVLAEHAQGESYTDAAGERFQGVEAVNQALGKGLMNQTAFGQQIDPCTGERNGAFFLLFLKERKLSYYGSDAQDRRGLGEENWIGNLDQQAITVMRNGARVVDAAKDTITSIDMKLDQRIAAEAAAQEKRAADQVAARNRALEQAQAALTTARLDYDLLQTKSAEVSSRLKLEGDLVRPGLTELAAELKLAQAALDQNDPAAAQRTAEAVHVRAQEHLRRLNQYPEDRARIEGLERELQRYQGRPYASGAVPQLRAARDSLTAVRHAYDRGDSSYVALLDNASRMVTAAGSAIQMAERMAEQRRILWMMSPFALGLMMGLVALVLNRRRLPAKTEALRLFELWEKALEEKDSALFGLMDRRTTLMGSSVSGTTSRFSGETLRLCQQIIQEVDVLLIMSVCARRILQQANVQVNPGTAWGKLSNLFRRRPYRRAVELLKDQPIAFQPEEGLELAVRGTRTERDRLIGPVDSYQPFAMTFNELIAAFNKRAESALDALDRIERSLLKGPEVLQAIQQQITATRAAETTLRPQSQEGLFLVAPVFAELLPSAQEALSEAQAASIHDPVGALQEPGARAGRQSEDAAALVAASEQACEKTMPAVRECAGALEKSGLKPVWLRTELSRLSLACDQTARVAVRESAKEQIESVVSGLTDLEQRSRRAMEIDAARRGSAQERMTRSTTAIDRARREIAAGLGLPAGEILREPGKDPTDYVVQAEEQWNAAFAALERGDLDAAQNALDSVTALTTEADGFVSSSKQAFTSHEETLKSLRGEVSEITTLIPARARILSEIQAGYAPSVLALGAGDPAHPNANGTLADNIQEAESHIAEVRRLLDQSVESYRGARLLEAMDQLSRAKGLLEVAAHRLAEIVEKKSRLETAVAANAEQLAKLQCRARECAALAAEPATMTRTLQVFEEAERALTEARAAVQAVPGDPFVVGTRLAGAEAQYNAVADAARSDRDLFEQAGRSLAAAANQAIEARRLATRSAGDNIPDSAEVRNACSEVESLDSTLQALRAQHGTAHGDWAAVDQFAVQLSRRAATAAAILRGELERAQSALGMLSTAATSVRNAGAWTGGFGVMILGAPGSDSLSQAHSHMQRGEYDLAFRLAEQARGVADRAVAQAQAEVTRRRLAEEAMREQERRERQAQEQARQFRSSSFGSSSSWGSSGSGSRTSSFQSGSGVSTSSW